jgi:hypothetical protein
MWTSTSIFAILVVRPWITGDCLDLPHIQSSSPLQTTTAVLLDQDPACGSVSSLCRSFTPYFSDFSSAQQTQCLCPSDALLAPDYFDNATTTCTNYVSTAGPSVYPSSENIESSCSSIENFAPAPVSASATSIGSTESDCCLVDEMIGSCAHATLEFMAMSPADQASCLCYLGAST